MQRNYHYSNIYLGMFLAFSGVGFVLASLVLVPLFLKIFKNEIYICVYSTMVLFILLFLIGFVENEQALWYFGFCLSAANVLAYTLILTLFSNAINESSQGWIMGITGSISAVSFGATALLLGPLSHWGLNTPIYAAAILGVISFCILVYYARQTKIAKKLNAQSRMISNNNG
jgi:predicted MFS family arabinose efflux permease